MRATASGKDGATMEISTPAALTANLERTRLGLLTVNLGQREVHTQIALP